MVRLGATDRWIDELLDTPNRIGMALDVPAPALRLLDISTPQESSNFGDGARESLHE